MKERQRRWIRCYCALGVLVFTWSSLNQALRWRSVKEAETDVFLSGPIRLPTSGGEQSSSLAWKESEKNRTLVILMGNLRGGEKAWRTLYENVLDVNNADLALMIGKTSSDHRPNSSLFARAKYLWEFDEYDDWADAFDLINGTGWRERVPPYLYNSSSIIGGVRMRDYQGSGGIIFMIRWFLIQELIRNQMTERYDRFVITRSDHYYLCRHDLSQLDPQYMWLPVGQDHGGLTDRHLVVNSTLVLDALNILPPLLEHPEDYSKLLEKISGNPERLIWRRWLRMKLLRYVKRFDRMMFTCAAPGDATRWKSMSEEKVEEGVHLKYRLEYKESQATCKSRSSIA